MDIIFIEQLLVFTKIGIYDWEQKIEQKLILNIELGYIKNHFFFKKKAKHYLDYEKVSKLIILYLKKNKFNLIEEVAEKIANLLIINFKSPWVRVKVLKPHAIAYANQVGVIIERKKIYK
ncbi:FolB domain-containing protein [Candidatus Providencia siddallii]|uniref:dihydroneopterin aldolase n=1 Tax=Candidatus Providencia siddallii TaxID=1715285 RepID=A0ABM9NP88_9GAMM